MAAAEDRDQGSAEIVLDDEVQIVPPGILDRSMMSMARHPDGSIYLNTQSGPLYCSADEGRTWAARSVEMPELSRPQVLHGLGISRDGRLWLSHSSIEERSDGLYGQDLYVSSSADGGRTWTQSGTDFGRFPPGIPNMQFHEDGNRTFIEQPDGTLMFTTTIVPAPRYAEQYPGLETMGYGGQPGDLFSDLVFRSTDGGETWGDPTQVHPTLNPHESNLAISPDDPDHILVMSRCQGELPPETDPDDFMNRTGNPLPYVKQGVLFESTDGGRQFRQVGWTNYYGHRANVYWAPSNTVVVTGCGGLGGCLMESCPYGGNVVARISLDGARTWLDESGGGAPDMEGARTFELLPQPPGHSFTTPTVELAPRHFLTVYGWYWGAAQQLTVNGILWHLEGPGAA